MKLNASVQLFCLLLAAAAVHAATVRTADETTIVGALTSIEGDNLLVLPSGADAPTSVALQDIVEVTIKDTPTTAPSASTQPTTRPTTQPSNRPTTRRASTEPRRAATAPTTSPSTTTAAGVEEAAVVKRGSNWRLSFTNGDSANVTIDAWADGRLSGTLVRYARPISFNVSALREAWRGTPKQQLAAKALGEVAGSDDIAFAVRGGDVLAVRGVAVGLSPDGLRFKYGGTERTIAIDRVVGVVFAQPTAGDSKPTFQQTVHFKDEILTGHWSAVSPAGVELGFGEDQRILIPHRDIDRIVFRNGRVMSLTDLRPGKVEETPYFDRLMPWRKNVSLDGKPLTLSDGPVTRGLAVHARSRLTYKIDGGYQSFRAKVGFQQPEGKLGQAVVRILGDEKLLFEQRNARGDQPPFEIDVSVAGVKELTLAVDFGDGEDTGDRIIWAQPRVIRSDDR